MIAALNGIGLRVVMDCGNGCAGTVVTQVFERMGHTVTPLFAELDGRFPNHLPDPEAGWAKLASGDPTWRDLSALSYHFETQPLPSPLANTCTRRGA